LRRDGQDGPSVRWEAFGEDPVLISLLRVVIALVADRKYA
jgi:hypothetical protein